MKSIPGLFVIFGLTACTAPTPALTPASIPALVLPPSTSVPSSGLSGQIVYSNENDIFVMDLADASVKRLTNDAEWDFDAAWSPDGTQIVFRSHRDGNEEIYRMNADGSNQTNLSRNPGGDWSPVWSPDGTRVAFFSEREGKSGIWVMDMEGDNAKPVGTSPGVNDYPTWSPDGERIAWNCTMGKLHPSGRGDFEICLANADGSGLAQLTDTEGDNKYPAWSPDGSQILFVSNRNGWPSLPAYEPLGYDPEAFGDEEIFVMNVDGTNQVNLTNNPREDDSFPAWSRDGSYMVYSRYGCLTVLNVTDPSQRIQLSKGNCTGTDSGTFPDWFQPVKGVSRGATSFCSPAISFMDEGHGQADIFGIDRDGSHPINLTHRSTNDLSPDWSPDGKTIVFESIRAGNYEIHAIDPDSSNPRPLARPAISGNFAEWRSWSNLP